MERGTVARDSFVHNSIPQLIADKFADKSRNYSQDVTGGLAHRIKSLSVAALTVPSREMSCRSHPQRPSLGPNTTGVGSRVVRAKLSNFG